MYDVDMNEPLDQPQPIAMSAATSFQTAPVQPILLMAKKISGSVGKGLKD